MSRAVILFGHGSRDPAWRVPMDEVARRVRQRRPEGCVVSAFLEFEQPDLETALDAVIAQGATRVLVIPMFLGVGKHAREDLPRILDAARLRHPQVQVDASPAVGERSEVLDLLATLALQQL